MNVIRKIFVVFLIIQFVGWTQLNAYQTICKMCNAGKQVSSNIGKQQCPKCKKTDAAGQTVQNMSCHVETLSQLSCSVIFLQNYIHQKNPAHKSVHYNSGIVGVQTNYSPTTAHIKKNFPRDSVLSPRIIPLFLIKTSFLI